jgi:hypothetical protein
MAYRAIAGKQTQARKNILSDFGGADKPSANFCGTGCHTAAQA